MNAKLGGYADAAILKRKFEVSRKLVNGRICMRWEGSVKDSDGNGSVKSF